MKAIYKFLPAIIMAATAMSCTEIIEQDRINISHSSFTFNAAGESVEICVDANCPWDIVNTNDWLTVSGKTDTSIVLTASPNEEDRTRQGAVEFLAGSYSTVLSVEQLDKSFTGIFKDLGEYSGGCFSKKGAFYCGLKIKYEGQTAIKYPTLINCRTGETKELEGSAKYSVISLVSDDGNIIAINLDGSTVIYDHGNMKTLEIPDHSWITVSGGSSDGNIMVGYAMKNDGLSYVPVKWTGLQPEFLDIPEKDITGKTLTKGAMARGCSDDGSVIYGSEWATQGLIYWKDGNLHYPGEKYAEQKTIQSEIRPGLVIEMQTWCAIKTYAGNYKISANGKFIAATYYDYKNVGADKPSITNNYAAVIDTDTDEAHFIRSDQYDIISAVTADNNGICFGGAPEPITDGYAMDYKTATLTPIQDWMYKQYGLVIGNDRVIMGVSHDENVIYGWRPILASQNVKTINWYYIIDPLK